MLVEPLIAKTAYTRGILAKTPDPSKTPRLLRRSTALMFFQKSHSEKPGSQEIDAKIERAIADRISEVHEQLDLRIRKQILDDRAFVKDTVGVAFRVAGSAVALVVIVLGALGWKNLAEIQKEMVKAAREKAEAQFVSKEGKQIIDATLDRSVLNSYLIQMALLKTDKAQRLRVEDHDAGRLLRIIKDTETDNVTFESAAKVLITALSQEGPGTVRFALVSDICETFAAFIVAKERDEKWLANNYQKRMWLLNELSETAFSHDLLRVAYRDLVETNAALTLRQAAVRNIGRIRDKEALDKLVRWAASGNELRLDALLAIAQIEVENKILTDWMSSLDKLPAPSSQEIAAVLKISKAIWEADRNASAKLMQFAFSHSVLVTGYRPRVLPGEDNRVRSIYVVPLSNLDGNMARMESVLTETLIEREIYWTGAVAHLLEKFAKQGDMKDFRAFVTWLTPVDLTEFSLGWSSSGPPAFAVEIMMSQNAAIMLEEGSKIDRSSSKGTVWLWPERWVFDVKTEKEVRAPSPLVRVIDPVLKSLGYLSGFENAGELRFRVHY